jgi:tetratricopeptide (TPR) repeat protein
LDEDQTFEPIAQQEEADINTAQQNAEEIPAEEQSTDDAPAETVTEIQQYASDYYESTADKPAEESPEESVAKAKNPNAPPSVLSWLIALVIFALAIPAVGLSVGNAVLSAPVAAGIFHEKTKSLYTAMEDFQSLDSLVAKIEETRVKLFSFGGTSDKTGFTAGNFALEHQTLLINKIGGPLNTYTNQYYEAFLSASDRVPRSLNKLQTQIDALSGIFDALSAEWDAMGGELPEDTTETAWILETIPKIEAADKDKKANALYYRTLEIYYSSGDKTLLDETQKKIADIKAASGSEPWMYEEIAIAIARDAQDYGEVLTICNDRLKRNQEDSLALEYRVKATFMNGKKEEAYALAQDLVNVSILGDAGKLLQAELYYRDGETQKAIRLCDAVIQAPTSDSGAMTATTTKAIAQLLVGESKEAVAMLQETYNDPPSQLDYNFAYACLVAAHLADDMDFYQEIAALIDTIPQQIVDLRMGKITAKDIYVNGWGELE